MDKTKERKKKGMDLGRVLLWSAVLTESPRWAGAMLAADMHRVDGWVSYGLNIANIFSGLAMGLLNVVAMAYMLDALRHELPTRTTRAGKTNISLKFWGILGFVVGLILLTPVVIAPYLVARMNGLDVAGVLTDRNAQFGWSIAVVIAPVFVVGGVAFAQNGLVKLSGDSPVSEKAPGEMPEPIPEPAPAPGEREPVYKSWHEVPESDWPWIANAPASEIVKRYRLAGKDPERTARAWKKNAKNGGKSE